MHEAMRRDTGQRAGELVARAPHGAVVIEVGAARGEMAEAAKAQRPDLTWVMVDYWRLADVVNRDPATKRDQERIDSDMAQAYDRAKTHRLNVLCMDSAQAARLVTSADVVFIDADHTYEGALGDILRWMPKVRPGGWLGGHDYMASEPWVRGVTKAVDEVFPLVERGADTTWWVRKC